MIHDERYYEVLVALAVAGQLCNAELLELEQHASHCSSCVQRRLEMEAASRQLFLSNALRTKSLSTPARMQERFLMRAIDEGIPLTLSPAEFSYPKLLRLAYIAAALLIIVSVGWKAVTIRHATEAKPAVDVSDAIASASVNGKASIIAQNAETYLSGLPPVEKRHHRPRRSQVEAQLPTAALSARSQAHGKPFFTVATAFFFRNAPMIDAGSGFSSDFDTLAADYFISPTNAARTATLSKISAPTLWKVSKQPSSNQRVFPYDARLAPLSFLNYSSEVNSKVRVPDLSIHNAFNPTQFR